MSSSHLRTKESRGSINRSTNQWRPWAEITPVFDEGGMDIGTCSGRPSEATPEGREKS